MSPDATSPTASSSASSNSPTNNPANDSAGELEFKVPHTLNGERVDVVVAKLCPTISRTHAGNLSREGAVLLNGRAVKPSVKVGGGETIQIELPEPEVIEATPENIPLDVIHEDADIIVINKAAGMVSHPSAGHATGSLVNALLFRCKDLSTINGSLRPGIVHRLDKDTTGVIVAAKNDLAHRALAAQFADRQTKKEYLALCHGEPQDAVFENNGRIGRHPARRTEMTVLKREGEGREAFTAFEVKERFAKQKMFFVHAFPRTGRTHQIRVHLAKIGFPIVADPLYGRESTFPELNLTRHALHAHRLTIDHPRTKQRVTFEAPLPKDMAEALQKLRA